MAGRAGHWVWRRQTVTQSVSEQPKLLDIYALADLLGLSHSSLRRWAKSPPPGFPAEIRFGKRLYWSRVQVEVWLVDVGKSAPQPVTEPAEQQPVERARIRLPKRPRKASRAKGG